MATSTPEKVVGQIKFEFSDKSEQINNFEALFGPNGILATPAAEESRNEISVTESDRRVIGQIEKSGEKRHKKHLKRKIIWEKMYKLRNCNRQSAQFELQLVHEESLAPRREGPPKLLALKIRKCQ